MSDAIIRVEGLGKRYRLRHETGARYRSLRDDFARAAQALFTYRGGGRSANYTEEEFWALRNVSFEVHQGEVVGIIGRNGTGKSTLLKILSRITEPSEGRVRIKGRVASLLEVGTGFHPELTGSENIFLNGVILGMTRADVRRRFDEIVAFAEVERFLDTPVKRYSSGMYVRLAFAVAAHLDPEIMVVDEVLAVGDVEFQKKCLGKMKDVSKGGRTVLFVSHNMSAVRTLCKRAILLRQGTVFTEGSAEECVAAYISALNTGGKEFQRQAQPSGAPTIVRGGIEAHEGKDAIVIACSISSASQATVSIDLRLTDQSGLPMAFGSLGTLDPESLVTLAAGQTRLAFRFPTNQLAVGTYLASLDLTIPDKEYLDRVESCLTFEVTRAPATGRGRVLQQAWGHGSYEVQLERVEEPANSEPAR